ncbi:MAG: hypothetical protein ACOKSU_03095 [Pseudomonas sp.]|uniref:hypothetical protein n=1 Tax=Pseudomonas TaxID=286 RepID=UPI0003C0B822|nr:hypothetical protein [Pseudomonas sp. VLB120]AGZ36114.1 hypothetical protein PVLB_16655 [Pseudomonas sp. VLB120]
MNLDATTPITTDIRKLLSVNGLIIDVSTGEIIGHNDTPSVLVGPAKYKCELGKCRSIDDFEDHLSFVDRRKLPPHALHSLRSEVDNAHGEWRRTTIDCRITIPQLRLLEQLHELVLYRNIIIMSQTDLAMSLGVAESNLMKKLRVLTDSHMLRVSTSRDGSMRKREIKLSVNPRLIFRGDDYTRGKYIEYWYQPTGHLHTVVTEPLQTTDFLTLAA